MFDDFFFFYDSLNTIIMKILPSFYQEDCFVKMTTTTFTFRLIPL